MKNKMMWKDLSRNRAVTLIILLFVCAAAALMTLAASLTVNLAGAVDRLMEEAKTPHFMQMHAGEMSMTELQAFASGNESVSQFQVSEFLNVPSDQIIIGGRALEGSLQDNGFCVQNQEFDFLLDLNDRRIQPAEGELYVPVFYMKDGIAKLGDAAEINGTLFTVAGFVRDSQMNSALAYSKRFVVSEADYSRIKPAGIPEYLIEFRLKDLSELGSFAADYSAAGLPANGPALTWPLFRLISAVSDGMMIAVILLICGLSVLIALFCIRFTLLAKIEDDYREIGVMKALGMRVSDIRGLYLSTYAVVAAAGGALGFALALLLHGPMTESVRLNLGGGGSEAAALLAGLGGTALLLLLLLLYVSINLRRFRRISAAEAIRFGNGAGKSVGIGGPRLSKNRWIPTNLFLGLQDVWVRKRLYGTMLVVIVLAGFISIVPQNLYHTISDENFVTYMGVGRCDLRMDVQGQDGIEEKTDRIAAALEGDPDITRYTLLETKTYGVQLKDGTIENIKVELGDHTVFPVQYAEGRMPEDEHEIALSSINAEEWGLGVGGRLVLLTAGEEKQLSVSGIYSDITNGGKTAKAVFADASSKTAWSVICAELADPEQQLGSKLAEYKEDFGFARISGIDEYVAQTFGQTLRSVRIAATAAALVAAAVTMLVVLLFMRLLAAKDRYSIAVMKAMGFTGRDIRHQYAWRALAVLATGLIFGTILAGTVGEQLAAAVISSFGAAAFRFSVNPLTTYFLCPLSLLAVALAAVAAGTSGIGRVRMAEYIKE